MGFFDKLTGTKRPADGITPLSAEKVHAALLGLNGADVPYVVKSSEENADLVAEWRLLEPAWRTFFLRAQVSRVFKVHMRLVPEKNEVRALDQQFEVEWVGDTPRIALSSETQRGQVRTVSKRRSLGRGENGEREETFSFDSDDLKDPLQSVVLDSGWVWRGVVSGKL
ncbi:hypothetical protein [Streptomyces sp. SID13726]|uniref:hypothetical protein n=1 Tax=Streptomyces sp. SID13726 TaxID=2706058 RepID=UPI0013B995F8|nr:hypothetical protein [Streptomyces sp. SID13726]NEB06194.1 hypothetical protein [Streptomyces sp. SID13726]